MSQHNISYTPLLWLILFVIVFTCVGLYQMQQPDSARIQTGDCCLGYCDTNPESYECKQLNSLKANDRRQDVMSVLEKRLKDYRADKDALSTNLLFQLAFVLLGLLVVTGSSESLETPIAGIKLPRVWMFYVVPLGLLFIWLEFGFLTDKMIQARHESWLLLEALASADVDADMSQTAVKADHLTMQMARLYEDGAYVDGWFVAFRGCEHVIDTTFRLGTNLFWSLIYGSLLGLTHAGAIFLAHIGNARYLICKREPSESVSSRYHKLLSHLGRILPYFVLAIILGSHYQFFSGGNNPNWMQLVIAIATITFGWLLLFTANSAASEGLGNVHEDAVEKQGSKVS